MDALRHKKSLLLLGLFFILAFYDFAEGLILPPDPFDSTDRYARLITASEGTITGVKAKVKAPGDPLGPGEVRALLQYKLPSPPGNRGFYFSSSRAVLVQGLSNSISTLMEFDLSAAPLPVEAYRLSPEQIEVGEKLRVKLFFSFGPGLNTIEAIVKVVWAKIDAERAGFYCLFR